MKQSLKIGISCYASAGGSGIVATELGLALARNGHEVHFITSGVPFRIRGCHENVTVHTVETMDYPLFKYPPYTLALAVKIHQVASFHGLDLLHVHYAIPHAASAILASQMGSRRIPIVTTLHGTDITLVGNHPSYHRITRFCIEQSDRVTAVSDWLADETHNTFRTDKRIRTIPNFVDIEKYSPENRGELRNRFASEDEVLLLHASNFRPVKRASSVVEMFSRMENRDRAVLVMAGDGPDLAKTEYMIKELGLTDRVHLIGAWENMEELLPVADIFLQPSEHESFGLAALESMSCGVTVMLTKNGGPGEFIKHDENGYLLDPEDLDSWVKIADKLVSDRLLRRRIGLNAHNTVVDNYSSGMVTDRYEMLFQDLIASKVD